MPAGVRYRSERAAFATGCKILCNELGSQSQSFCIAALRQVGASWNWNAGDMGIEDGALLCPGRAVMHFPVAHGAERGRVAESVISAFGQGGDIVDRRGKGTPVAG